MSKGDVMLFVYLVAAVMAGGVSYGSFVLLTVGVSVDSSVAGYGLAMVLLVAITIGSAVAVYYLVQAAYSELVYWDFF